MDESQAAKLDKFMVSVNSEVEAQIDSIIKDAEILKKEQLEQAEDEALLEAYNRIQKSVKDIEGSCRREYALKQQTLRTDILKHREELTESIFASVRNKISEFTESDKYESYMFSLVDSEKIEGKAVIAVSQKDSALSAKLKSRTGWDVETNEKIKLGGLEIIDGEKGIVIDKTLDSALEEQRKNFSVRYSFSAAAESVKE